MDMQELLNSKAVKGFTKCLLGILVFAVVIEGIVALVVTSTGVNEGHGGSTSVDDSVSNQVPPLDRKSGQERQSPANVDAKKVSAINSTHIGAIPTHGERAALSNVPVDPKSGQNQQASTNFSVDSNTSVANPVTKKSVSGSGELSPSSKISHNAKSGLILFLTKFPNVIFWVYSVMVTIFILMVLIWWAIWGKKP